MMSNASELGLVLQEFDKACNQVQNPSTRQAAEGYLMNFKKSHNVIPMAKYILDHTHNTLSQFYAAQAMRESIGQQYAIHSKQFFTDLQSYIVQFVLSRASIPGSTNALPHFVREQLLCTVAVIVKRGWLENQDSERAEIFKRITDLLHGDVAHKQVAISLLSCLLDEFTSSKASAIGLTWDYHHQCLLIWESSYLKPSFDLLIQILQALTDEPQQNVQLITLCIKTIETILSWEFVSLHKDALTGSLSNSCNRALQEDSDSSSNPALTTHFPSDWRDVLVTRTQLLDLCFRLHTVYLNEQTLSHRLRQCLVALASIGLSPGLFQNEQEKATYVAKLVEGIGHVLSSCLQNNQSSELFHGATLLLHRLFSTYKFQTLASLPSFPVLLDHVYNLTLHVLRAVKSLSDDNLEAEDTWTMDAADLLLESWSLIVSQLSQIGVNPVSHLVASKAGALFGEYTNMRLGLMNPKTPTEDDDDESDEGLEFKDHETYYDQLGFIAQLGRCCIIDSTRRMNELFAERIEAMKNVIAGGVPSPHVLDTLHEQIHWLIIISGFLVTDEANGEKPLIPTAVLESGGAAENTATLCHHVLNLLQVLCSSPTDDNLSPLVVEDIFWFLARWTQSYLFAENSEYSTPLPDTITARFGQTTSGIEIVDFLLHAVHRQCEMWTGEGDALTMIIQFLSACSKTRAVELYILQTPYFIELLAFFLDKLSKFPETVHKPLIQTLITMASSCPNEQLQITMLNNVTSNIKHRFQTILHRPDFVKHYQRPEVVSAVVACLEMFTGLASANNPQTAAFVMAFVKPFLPDLIKLGSLYKSVTEMEVFLIEFFAALIRNTPFDLIPLQDRQALYISVMSLLKQFATNHVGKHVQHRRDDDLDEESVNDLCVALELLADLVLAISDLGDISQERLEDGSGDAADVIYFGVNTILPLMNKSILEIPRLCRIYTTLIARLMTHLPQKLSSLPSSLVESLVMSLEFGIHHSIFDVARDAVEAVGELANWVRKQEAKEPGSTSFYTLPLNHLLAMLLKLLMHQDFDSDLIESLGEALLSLIITRRDYYATYVQQIIHESTNPATQTVLQEAFTGLESSLVHVQGVIDLRGAGGVSKTWWREWDQRFAMFLTKVRGVCKII